MQMQMQDAERNNIQPREIDAIIFPAQSLIVVWYLIHVQSNDLSILYPCLVPCTETRKKTKVMSDYTYRLQSFVECIYEC